MLLDGWKTFRLIRTALASSHWPAQQLRRVQEEQLRKLLAHAYGNVPLYRTLYDEAGFRPEHFRSLDDLDTIPILQKQRLKAAHPEEVVAHGVDPRRCATVDTSGSTGTPLRIYLGSHDLRWQRAVAWRILFEHGFRWTDRTLEIRMTLGRRFFIQQFGLAPKEWVSILDPPESWVQRLVETQPQVVVAGAGALQALAEAIATLGLEPPGPRLVISDSETLAPTTRRLVHHLLGTEPVDVFGLVELANFAWECEQHCGFHVSADSHIVEIDAPPGEPGPMIATALGMWTMPIIRYDTGDLAERESRPCPCGRSLPILRRLYGRAVDAIVLPDGSRLFWPFFHEVLGRYIELQQWRVLQEEGHRLRLQVVMPTGSIGPLARIEADLREALPGEVVLQVECIEKIPQVPGEKSRMVISRCSTP
ncbi:MAG: phenylacetate--CoA ligase family protein [Deltaproteobacteria bacterium]|nr:phenylacetate--CoA ligase family protein [Deltaproteobacteria bacterium]